jgi:glycosyltransferase involved in cell wall biosynthesis
VLVLTRSYPSALFPALGLWIERPTVLLTESCDLRVVSPVPYCPWLPALGPLRHYVGFRAIPRQEIRDGVQIQRPRVPIGPGHSFYGLESRAIFAAVRRPVERLRADFPFDAIHAHFVYPEGAAARRLARHFGVPYLITEHAPWTPAWFARRAVRREALAAARDATALLAVSRSVRDSIIRYTGAPERVHVIPVGVDAKTFAPAPEGRRRADQILYVGWLNYNKGVDVLLQAVDELRRRGRPGSVTLVGGSYYRDTQRQEVELRRLAASLNLGDRVNFAGRLPQSEVARLMQESAVVVLPSRAESFGAVLVEALACGTPVVSTRCGGPEDIVTPAVGRLVEPGEPGVLADAIDAVLSSRDEFPPERLRAYALERFEWGRIVAELHKIYAGMSASPSVEERRTGLKAIF